MAISPFLVLRQILEPRLGRKSRAWLKAASTEVADDVGDARFCALLSLGSRHARQHTPLLARDEERAALARATEGVEIEGWSLLETLRVVLILSRSDLGEESGAVAIEEAFRYADEGETCALYRSLAFLPQPERFLDRAREGCRSNMLSVFNAAALDTPFPRDHFDDLAWNQAALKALFIGAPLWRLVGLDQRLSEDLCRMALDLVDERRSAGRAVQPELWLLLGGFGGERARTALEAEVAPSNPNLNGRRAAAIAFARAGLNERLAELKESETQPAVAATMAQALAGQTDRKALGALLF